MLVVAVFSSGRVMMSVFSWATWFGGVDCCFVSTSSGIGEFAEATALAAFLASSKFGPSLGLGIVPHGQIENIDDGILARSSESLVNKPYRCRRNRRLENGRAEILQTSRLHQSSTPPPRWQMGSLGGMRQALIPESTVLLCVERPSEKQPFGDHELFPRRVRHPQFAGIRCRPSRYRIFPLFLTIPGHLESSKSFSAKIDGFQVLPLIARPPNLLALLAHMVSGRLRRQHGEQSSPLFTGGNFFPQQGQVSVHEMADLRSYRLGNSRAQ